MQFNFKNQKIRRTIFLLSQILPICIEFMRIKNPDDNMCISLTSYGFRIKTTALTIISLLLQSDRPHVYLFIASSEIRLVNLPLRILSKLYKRFEIIACDDVKSYKKIMPLIDLELLCHEKDRVRLKERIIKYKYVITADDDIFYLPQTSRRMMKIAKSNDDDTVVYNTGMLIDLKTSYANWEIANGRENKLVLPVGAGGILYPINQLMRVRDNNYLEIAPTTDDIWLYAQLRNYCSYHYCNSSNFVPLSRLLRQKHNLFSENKLGANDLAIERLLR